MYKLLSVKTTGEIITKPDDGATYINVTIHWYCDGRTWPVVPYPELIPDWNEDDLQGEDAKRIQSICSYANQFFSESETELLSNYLRNLNGAEVQIDEINLPVNNPDLAYFHIPTDPDAGEGYGFIDLLQTEDYPLPFRVRGYFDMEFPNVAARYEAYNNLRYPKQIIPPEPLKPEEIKIICEKLYSLKDTLINLRNNLSKLTGDLNQPKKTSEN